MAASLKKMLGKLEKKAGKKRAKVERWRRRATEWEAELRTAESHLEAAATANRIAKQHNNELLNIISLATSCLHHHDSATLAADIRRLIRDQLMPSEFPPP